MITIQIENGTTSASELRLMRLIVNELEVTSVEPSPAEPADPEVLKSPAGPEVLGTDPQPDTGDNFVVDVSVDSAGIPWDERIHSKGRTVTADGRWRYKKGVSDETKQAVEQELSTHGPAPVPHPVVEQADDATAPPPPPPAPSGPVTPPPLPVVETVASGGEPFDTWPTFLQQVMALNIPLPELNEVAKRYQVDSFMLLVNKTPAEWSMIYKDLTSK